MKSSQNSIDRWIESATAGLDPKIRQRLRLELRSHFDDAYDAGIASGLSIKEAVSEAISALGEPHATSETFQEQYELQAPWENDDYFLAKLQTHFYGYLEGSKLVGCEKEELLRKCRADQIQLAWTPETERVVPIEQIPFLAEAVRKSRDREAGWDLIVAASVGFTALSHWWNNPVVFPSFAFALAISLAYRGASDLFHYRTASPRQLAADGEQASLFAWLREQRSAGVNKLLALFLIIVAAQLHAAKSFDFSATIPAGDFWSHFVLIFLHTDVTHVLVSLTLLLFCIERLVGSLALPIFVLSSLGGAFLSVLLSAPPLASGSAGALGLVTFSWAMNRKNPRLQNFRLGQIPFTFVLFGGLFSYFAADRVNSTAHLGGLFAGLTLGLSLSQPYKLARKRWVRIAAAFALGILLAAALAIVWSVLLSN